jgi:hypothetical protein
MASVRCTDVPARLARHYPLARWDAARETRLPLATFGSEEDFLLPLWRV